LFLIDKSLTQCKFIDMLFEEQISRKPNLYPWTEDFVNAMHNGFWTDKEFNFQSDVQDFKVNLSEQEREIVKRTLSAIGQVEVSVKKFWANLGNNLPHPGITDLGFVMANIEVIHNNAYERLLSVLGLEDVFEENLKLPIIKGRVDYLRKYLNKCYKDERKQYVYSLILFTLFVENVSLFSQFYIINWFNRYENYLKDTAQQVAYTSREEDIHAKVGVRIVNTLREEYPDLFDDELILRLKEEANCAFEAESKIIDWIIGDYEKENISAEILKEFIKNRLNESLKKIGFDEAFVVDKQKIINTIWFDEDVLGNSATDFFFKRPIEYSKKDKSFDEDDLF
jgi:ribonucleoside-diphosphate reductase beta chain